MLARIQLKVSTIVVVLVLVLVLVFGVVFVRGMGACICRADVSSKCHARTVVQGELACNHRARVVGEMKPQGIIRPRARRVAVAH